jgi:hypothetical protein
METTDFLACTKRLLLALGLATETELATQLGFVQSTWAARKRRGSIPSEQIDALIAERGLNPEYIYRGKGNVLASASNQPWLEQFKERVQIIQLDLAALAGKGHTAESLNLVLEPKGKVKQALEVLRDYRDISRIDLNWLICAEPHAKNKDSLSKGEVALVEKLRAMDESGRAFVQQAADLAHKRGTK